MMIIIIVTFYRSSKKLGTYGQFGHGRATPAPGDAIRQRLLQPTASLQWDTAICGTQGRRHRLKHVVTRALDARRQELAAPQYVRAAASRRLLLQALCEARAGPPPARHQLRVF